LRSPEVRVDVELLDAVAVVAVGADAAEHAVGRVKQLLVFLQNVGLAKTVSKILTEDRKEN